MKLGPNRSQSNHIYNAIQHTPSDPYLRNLSKCVEWCKNLKVMLHGTIRNADFQRNRALQHCCDIVSNSYNTVPTLQRNMPWRKQICIAKCLYSYRDDLPKYLFKKSWLKSEKSPLRLTYVAKKRGCLNSLIWKAENVQNAATIVRHIYGA